MNQIAWNNAQAIFEEERKRFASLVGRCEETQHSFLAGLIRRNRDTCFGQAHGFSSIAGYRDYAAQVPLANFERIHPFIERILQGEKRVLTEEDVCFVERTGGSTGGAKNIPYTPSALKGFQKALFPWFADLLDRRPGIKNGTAYFAISPAGREENARAGVLPLGSNDDASYFGGAANYIREVQVVPHDVTRLENLEEWRRTTARLLMEAEDVSFIFIWSPTFLIELLRIMPPAKRLWPKLDTISCWMDAGSAPFARQLQELFPHVYFQPKGLLSTEAAVSIPFGDDPAPVLALESCFFEFADDAGNIHLAHQLRRDADYRVIISNHSGLYRYDTGDLVRVAGYTGDTPRLVFQGRAGLVTDLCGEKLSEAFVLRCFGQLQLPQDICAFLVPTDSPHPHYILFVDSVVGAGNEAADLAGKLDALLRQNPQYDYARRLGQLSALRAQRLANAYGAFCAYAVSQGRQIGTLKPPVLLKSFVPPHAGGPIPPG